MSPEQPIEFYRSVLERGLRSERARCLAIAEMYVQGVSSRRVQEITQKMCGLDVSSFEVSRASELLDEELSRWRERELGERVYLVPDARYEKVRVSSVVRDCAVLVALGVTPEGKRSVVGARVSLSDAEVHWRDFFASFQERLHGVQLVTSDDHKGLRAAMQARLTGAKWQRCQCHLQRNASAKVARVAMRKEIASDLPATHRRRLGTNNSVECLNKEIRRCTRVAGLFPSEDSLLRLITAIVSEICDAGETDRHYLFYEQPGSQLTPPSKQTAPTISRTRTPFLRTVPES